MKKSLRQALLLLGLFIFLINISSPSYALEVKLSGIENGGKIPEKFAFCEPDGNGKTKNAANINPEISWKNAPESTKSFALLVVDPDVPTIFDDANKEGKTIAKNLKRRDFYHWILVDIPADRNIIKQGEDSNSYLETGKKAGKTAYGINGRNDYHQFMKGDFGGYDGPCPPWNDEALHHYHFQLYALDVESLNLGENFTGLEAKSAIEKHKIAFGEVVGTYTILQSIE